MPPYEWPTSTTAPFCNESIRFVAATSSSMEVSGSCTATTWRFFASRSGITLRQLEASTNAPCTRTTLVCAPSVPPPTAGCAKTRAAAKRAARAGQRCNPIMRVASGSSEELLRRERHGPHALAGRVEDRVCDRARDHRRARLARAPRLLPLPFDEGDDHVGYFRVLEDGIARPVDARNLRPIELDLLDQRPAGRLDHVAFDLVPQPVGVDDLPAVVGDVDFFHADLSGLHLHVDVGDDADVSAHELVPDVGHATTVHDVALGRLSLRARGPAGKLPQAFEQLDPARVFQIAEPIFEWIRASPRPQHDEEARVRESVLQAPGRAYPRRRERRPGQP